MSANSVAMLQSETPNLDLPPTQIRDDHDDVDDDINDDDDDDSNDFDDDYYFDTLISTMLMMMMGSPGAHEQAPVTGSQEAPL